jgi:predicted RNase H-like nuclease
MRAAGADGTPNGWAVALLRDDDRIELHPCRDVAAVVERAEGAPVGIDVPIGLPEEVGPRECDREARKRLGSRASVVFNPPARFLLGARGYPEVRRRVAQRGGPKMSAQGAGLLPKIEEVDAFVARDPGAPVYEVHPELCFLELNGSVPLAPKKSPAGTALRLDLLRDAFAGADDAISSVDWPARDGTLVDVLDALVALWTARRIEEGVADRVGDGDPGWMYV